MTENKNQIGLQQLITAELLEVITRIAALSLGSFPNETCERAFVEGLKNVINSEVDLAWESVKLLNKLDKKTPQDVRNRKGIEVEKNYLIYVELPNLINRIMKLGMFESYNNDKVADLLLKEIKKVSNAELKSTLNTIKILSTNLASDNGN